MAYVYINVAYDNTIDIKWIVALVGLQYSVQFWFSARQSHCTVAIINYVFIVSSGSMHLLWTIFVQIYGKLTDRKYTIPP